VEIPTPMSSVTDLASRYCRASSETAKGINPPAAKEPSVVASDQIARQTAAPETNRGQSEEMYP